MTTLEFAQRIKSKYPQYASVNDDELAQKMLTKYPQYQSQITQVKQKQPLTAMGIANKVTDFIGAREIADTFGTDIARFRAKTAQEKEDIDLLRPSLRATVGSALRTGSIFVPGTQASTLGRIAAGSAAGYMFDVGGNLQSGSQSPFTPGIGTAIGAGLPTVGALATAIKKATANLPNRIVQSALGQSKPQLMAGKDVSEYVLQNKIVGTTDSLLKGSQAAIDDISGQINIALGEKAPKTVRILKNEILSEVVESINSSGGLADAAEIRKIVDSLAPQARALLNKQSLSLTEANKLRYMIDRTLGDRAFLGGQLPYNKEILKSFNSALREKVKSLAPEGTRELFGILSKEITLRDALLSKAAQQAKNQVVNAFDLILAGGGFLGGGPTGALGAFALKKGSQSTLGKTGAASLLRGTQNLLQPIGAALPQITPLVRGALSNIANQNDRIGGRAAATKTPEQILEEARTRIQSSTQPSTFQSGVNKDTGEISVSGQNIDIKLNPDDFLGAGSISKSALKILAGVVPKSRIAAIIVKLEKEFKNAQSTAAKKRIKELIDTYRLLNR